MTVSKISMRRKMSLILIVALLCFVAVIVKLFILQFIQGDDLQTKAEAMRTRDLTVSAARGTIYDVNGNKMALSITADSVGVYTGQIDSASDARNIASELATILGMDENTVYERITSDSSFVWVKRKIDFDIAEMVEDAELSGIVLVEETQRFYPLGTLAAHVLGFAGIDNQGLEGLELTYDEYLKGEDGSITGKYDAEERAIPQAEYEYIEPVDGYDVYLTIDENIQYFCERELYELMNSETPPKRAGIIIMDPDTCAILAMACTNPFDPNDYGSYDSSSYRNFLISDSYEPGSVFKIITLSSALEEGVVSESSSFNDPGSINVSGTTIHCWATKPHGMQSLAESVANSCNPAFVQIGQSIEAKQDGLFYKYINAYGFGKLTDISLSGEAEGILQDESMVNSVELATISIGQGIAVTPIQMITAICAVANDGILLKPQIVSKVMNGEEVVYEMKAEEVRRVISAETAAKVRSMLIGVVTDGSGGNAAIEGYTIGGKTGTAQKAENGVYASGKYIGSFVGMVPADDPELVCLVIVDEPSGIYYGSQTAAPVFKEVISDTLRYLNIAPSEDAMDGIDDERESVVEVQVPNAVNLDVESAKAAIKAAGLNVTVEGDGPLVTSQVPAARSYVDSSTTVVLSTGGISTNEDGVTFITVPNLHGKRFAEIANLLSALGLKLSSVGEGEAVSQVPAAGSAVTEGSVIKVVFDDVNAE